MQSSQLNNTMDMLDADRSMDNSRSPYMFGRGRDSVVNKSNMMRRNTQNRLAEKAAKTESFPTSSATMKEEPEPVPLELMFPFPLTRRVDQENVHKQELRRRRSSIELISPLRPEVLQRLTLQDADELAAQDLNKKLGFMLGRNGEPSEFFQPQAQLTQDFVASQNLKETA